MKPDFGRLEDAAGELLMKQIHDDEINEIMLNPDGVLWVENCEGKMFPIGKIEAAQALNFVRTVAGIQGHVVNHKESILETRLPFDDSRFQAMIPPTTNAAAFVIRKKAKKIYRLTDYIKRGILTSVQADLIRQAIIDRKNILICGGPGTGKTTFINACLAELVELCDPEQRIISMEDVEELQCSAPNVTAMFTSVDKTLTHLLRATLRSRPDRILVGEVRGGEMLDLLKSWNTGAPGGIATVHANGVAAALQRCCDLAQEAGVPPPINLILETVNMVVAIERINGAPGRIVKEVAEVIGYEDGEFIFKNLAQ